MKHERSDLAGANGEAKAVQSKKDDFDHTRFYRDVNHLREVFGDQWQVARGLYEAQMARLPAVYPIRHVEAARDLMRAWHRGDAGATSACVDSWRIRLGDEERHQAALLSLSAAEPADALEIVRRGGGDA